MCSCRSAGVAQLGQPLRCNSCMQTCVGSVDSGCNVLTGARASLWMCFCVVSCLSASLVSASLCSLRHSSSACALSNRQCATSMSSSCPVDRRRLLSQRWSFNDLLRCCLSFAQRRSSTVRSSPLLRSTCIASFLPVMASHRWRRCSRGDNVVPIAADDRIAASFRG